MKKRILISVSAVLVLVLLLGCAQAVVMPKYTDNPEGALIGEYYDSGLDHDVLFIGDCEVYESFVPTVLWEEYGIRSYVRGSAQQLVWQSYYLLEETFRYENPKTVVFNVLALKYGTPQNEAYNRMTLDGMRWSQAKWNAIRASMTEDESMVEYLFPLLRFHSRVTSLTADDFRYAFRAPTVSHNGYLMQTGIEPMTDEDVYIRGLSDYTLPATAMDYLEKMRVLCEENGAELILIKSPTNSWGYWWYDEWDAQMVEYAAKHNLSYYNFISMCGDIGIDWQTDTYDRGVHLNVYGAEKMTRYFGALLCENHGYTVSEPKPGSNPAWETRVKHYYEQKTQMEHEMKKEKTT